MDGQNGDETDESVPMFTKLLYSIGGTTSIAVSVTFMIALALQRDALMVSFFIGAASNGALSKILKRLLNQDRPDPTASSIEQPSDKGMPSSHAMVLGFIGTFTMLTVAWTKYVIPVYVAISLFYRIQAKLHTVEQVAVGIMVGSLNGILWRYLVDGNNPFGVNVMEWVSTHFLNSQGLLPVPLLIVPAIVGAVTVGSLERKISKFIKKSD